MGDYPLPRHPSRGSADMWWPSIWSLDVGDCTVICAHKKKPFHKNPCTQKSICTKIKFWTRSSLPKKTLHKKYLAHIVLCTKILGRTCSFHKKAPLTQSTLHKKHSIQKILSAQTLFTKIKFAQNAIILYKSLCTEKTLCIKYTLNKINSLHKNTLCTTLHKKDLALWKK